MPYRRFFLEAEPGKISACGSCGAPLRRSRQVFLLLAAMVIFGIAPILAVTLILSPTNIPVWIFVPVIVLLLAGWTLLTNYLGWRLVGWVPETTEKK